jgi:hypothetical protein
MTPLAAPPIPRWLLLWLTLLPLSVAKARFARPDDLDSRRAAQFLHREKGLCQIPGGNVWLTDTERRAREHLAGLDDVKREILDLQKSLNERIHQNQVVWDTSRQQIATLKAALPATKKDSEKRQIERQIKELETKGIEPNRLAAEPDVRTALIRFTNARHRLALAVIAIRRLVPQMDDEYRQLAQSPDVQRALRALGEQHRLGPVGNGYRLEIRKLDEYERLVFTSWLPLYQESGRLRVGAIVNETTPITVTWQTSHDPTVLTVSMAEAAGIADVSSGEAVPITLAQGRQFIARRVAVPSIRLGSLVLQNVPALILPPDGEDLGAQLGLEALGDHYARVELEKLRLLIDPK